MDAKKTGQLEPLEFLLEREKHAPLLTTDDLHAMPDDALREIIRLCDSQLRIYRACTSMASAHAHLDGR